MVTDDPARGGAGGAPLSAPRTSKITPDSLEEFRRQLSTGAEDAVDPKTWSGSLPQTILDLVPPDPEAEWMAFYSLGEGVDGGIYYDAHPIEHMRHHLTMLAYDMNGEPLSYGHGAPLRLRNESEHGFKQVKWLGGIEFVRHFSELGAGRGGYNQDHEFFGYRHAI